MAKGEWFLGRKGKKWMAYQFYIRMDDLSSASTLSDSLALYDSAKRGVG